jgi:hypothetical protein
MLLARLPNPSLGRKAGATCCRQAIILTLFGVKITRASLIVQNRETFKFTKTKKMHTVPVNRLELTGYGCMQGTSRSR